MQNHLMQVIDKVQNSEHDQTDRDPSAGDAVFEDALSDPEDDVAVSSSTNFHDQQKLNSPSQEIVYKSDTNSIGTYRNFQTLLPFQ